MLLLALVTGLLGLMVQATLASRQQIARLEARVRTQVELREAGAFGTGGFGGDKPIGEHDFTLDTLARVRSIPRAGHLARVDEYVYTPQIDTARPDAYAMIIGLRPSAAMRAIGEVDYENARILSGRGLAPADAESRVAVVGRLYATQRLGIEATSDQSLAGWFSRRCSLFSRSPSCRCRPPPKWRGRSSGSSAACSAVSERTG